MCFGTICSVGNLHGGGAWQSDAERVPPFVFCDNPAVAASSSLPAFREPSPVEKFFNRLFGFLVGLGLGMRHNYLLQVCGRKTGRVYSTPVNVLEMQGKRFLVAPRGRTQWVRNAEAVGEVTLKRGRSTQKFRLRSLPESARPQILKEYLARYATTVQRYFPVPAGSPREGFAPLAAAYPVFELLPL